MFNYADFLDFLAAVKTVQNSRDIWVASHDGAISSGSTEKEAIERLLETLIERGSL